MNNLNKKRFWNYAQWDYTINQKFYRNSFIVFALTILFISLICSLWRCFIISIGIINDSNLWFAGTTCMYFIETFLYIIGGCVFHPLRNKQGRITHLTIPATNLEKFLWHLLICIGGCFVICVISVLVSDLLNILITCAILGADHIDSITKYALTPEAYSLSNIIPINRQTNTEEQDFILTTNILSVSLWLCTIASAFCSASICTLVNSLKYKFNLPITTIIIYVISFIIMIIIIVGSIVLTFTGIPDCVSEFCENAFNKFKDISKTEGINAVATIIFIITTIILIITVGFNFWAYKIYCNAQIINKLNK